MQASITLQHSTLHFFCLYRPPPNRRNNLTDSMSTEKLPDLLDYITNLPGFVCLVGDMNLPFWGVHPLRMITTSSSTLRVGLTVAEEANATILASMNIIRNWAEHSRMLMSATAAESRSSIVFIVKL